MSCERECLEPFAKRLSSFGLHLLHASSISPDFWQQNNVDVSIPPSTSKIVIASVYQSTINQLSSSSFLSFTSLFVSIQLLDLDTTLGTISSV